MGALQGRLRELDGALASKSTEKKTLAGQLIDFLQSLPEAKTIDNATTQNKVVKASG